MGSVMLQSKDHRDLLDIIDTLRSKGISRYVNLPEIIVCDDQSAGRSSVLEAISGMSFPTKDNLCTRFATELVLRRDATPGVKVSINPGPERSVDERERLSHFHLEIDIVNPNLGSVVEKTKEAMGVSDTKVFSTDTLRVELCGPTQPHLILVDFPGLFRTGNRDQSIDDAATVRKMEVTESAGELALKGTRTLGFITQLDTLDTGSDSEASYLKLAQNKDVVFRLGWHVLKNRNYEMKDTSSAERDEAEENFFATGIWTPTDPTHLGVKSLKPRLSNVLKDQILHLLLKDVESTISECQSRLERLGTPRATFEEQRRYLLRASQDFSVLMNAAVDGIYNNPLFGSAKTEEGYQKRLRAVVQNALTDFEKDMLLKGHASSLNSVSRSDYINEVRGLMRKSRGCVPLGTFNPLIIDIAVGAKEFILHAVYRGAQTMLDHIAVDETADGIFWIISGGIDTLKSDLNQKVTGLLDPHCNGHPITYNLYLTDNVRKARSDRRRCRFEGILKASLGIGSIEQGYKYRVTLKKFIDNVSVLAIEHCYVRRYADDDRRLIL
ncbi:hypothetical protein K469DRAFT_770488, partial [Zopfia rhizophila CBS 207.26]